ncbi:hypothetical protein BDQ94DRAFT_135905 [Aspergillus welwitschiae]|uniref:Uncharacterized protein n=1 Tax=Aspergillus welwitschiae TaxID=1341132 RepID=A0A3F3QGE0_9EURO|nr:hypothetical protein BDQ94DRAFT_135905 [Aspergillus welwitschiae]RDH38231.1 hypothetical protein BDQ94DRAFT_135905 [Aspergillus welwitschiae]
MEEFSLSSSNRNGKDGCLAARLLASPLTLPRHSSSLLFDGILTHLFPSYVLSKVQYLIYPRNTREH